MTNYEATAYARIALLNLLERKADINPDTLLYEMHSLFDLYNEETIVKEVLYRLQNKYHSERFLSF